MYPCNINFYFTLAVLINYKYINTTSSNYYYSVDQNLTNISYIYACI